MRPFGDAQGAAVVLLLDGVADVDEFAVFEDEEVVFCGERFQACDCFGAEVGEDVDVGFYYGDVRAEACSSGSISYRGCRWARDIRSARSRSSLVVVTSADTVTLVFLASAISKSFLVSALG